ncbi:MAG: helix-turn-helix domain-containing protein [Peptococcaceae bacterium]|nr:helix-turn-helix domain-containing protein [Peptococcaceae bacterium]
MAGEGGLLREAREARGLTLADIEQIIKIRRVYLQALENEMYEEMPGDTYIRGFLRGYARVVGLKPDEIVEMYLDSRRPKEIPILTEKTLKKTSVGKGPLVAVLVVVLGIVGFLGYHGYRQWAGKGPEAVLDQGTGQETETETEEDTKSELGLGPGLESEPGLEPGSESDEEAVPSTSVNTAPLTAEIFFEARCWMKVKADGRVVMEETVDEGATRTITAEDKIEFVSIGFPPGIRIVFNGKELPRFGVTPVSNFVLTADNQR